MKEYFPPIVGNRELKRRLAHDIDNNKIAHAYIIEGAPGSGKTLLTRQIIAALNCENRGDGAMSLPCGVCDNCRKILEGKCTDVQVISKEDKATIGVDTIRGMKNSSYYSSNELDTKCYIIDEADKMTTAAQNALLIVLEEPRTDIKTFLLCENADSLLPTVKSRAPTLRTEHLPFADIAEYLQKNCPEVRGMSKDELYGIALVADGSIGRALSLLSDGDGEEKLRNTAKTIISLIASNKKSDLLAALNANKTNRTAEIELFYLLRLALRDIIVIKRGGDTPLCFYIDRSDADAEALKISIRAATELIALIDEITALLKRNLSVSPLMTKFVTHAADAMKA